MDHKKIAKIVFIVVVVLVAIVVTIILLTSVNTAKDEENKNATMKILFSIFRHGARSPSFKIPNNPNNDEWLKMGDGELTDIGKEQQILSGQLTRQNYESFLSKSLNDSEVYIQSTSMSRTILSAKYFVIGLFNLSEDKIWNTTDLNEFWPSIKVHEPYEKDYYLKIVKRSVVILRQFPNSTFNQHTIDTLVNATGLAHTEYAIETVFWYADALTIDAFMNMSAPFGLEAHMEDIAQLIADIFDAVLLKIYREIAFPALNDVVERIDAFQNGNSSLNTHVICLHDFNIAAIFIALTNTTIGHPPFSSLIYLEFHSVDDNVDMDYIAFKYRASVSSGLISFPIINCGSRCPYHTFKSIVGQMNSSRVTLW